jgi:hypothetical protein
VSAQAEELLREMALVFHFTQSVKQAVKESKRQNA